MQLAHDEKHLAHRRFLAHPESHRRFVGGDIFARIGGVTAIDALIDGLYERIETDAALRPLFGRETSNERAAQKRFFTEWLGGEHGYSDRAHLPLKHRHELLPITHGLAEKWLAHFRSSLDSAVSDADARRAIYDDVHLLAMALVNEGQPPSAPTRHALALGVGFSIPSSRRCSRALEHGWIDPDRGSESRAQEIKVGRTIPNMSPRSFVMAPVLTIGASRVRTTIAGVRRRCTMRPKQVS